MITFINKGVIDPRSITTFGVSSKETANAIGYFGTGLKYAIAVLLRNGQGITIHAGSRTLKFGVRKSKIRVDNFDIVTMNGRALAFTTELGKNWELWQAYRELYCNCTDESGTIEQTTTAPGPEPRNTVVEVTGAAFEQVHATRHIIILGTQPLFRCKSVNIHPGESKFLYYKGIRIMELERPTLYTYDIQCPLDLTEDRTPLYQFQYRAALNEMIAAEIDAPDFIKAVLTVKQNQHFEAALSPGDLLESYQTEVFQVAARTLFENRANNLNDSVYNMCRRKRLQELPETGIELDGIDRKRLDKAVKFCEDIGFNVREYPIVIMDTLSDTDNVLGRAHEGRIYLARKAFNMGTKIVAGTLFEEFIHLKHGVRDYTREFQDLVIDRMMSLGEQITGEVL